MAMSVPCVRFSYLMAVCPYRLYTYDLGMQVSRLMRIESACFPLSAAAVCDISMRAVSRHNIVLLSCFTIKYWSVICLYIIQRY